MDNPEYGFPICSAALVPLLVWGHGRVICSGSGNATGRWNVLRVFHMGWIFSMIQMGLLLPENVSWIFVLGSSPNVAMLPTSMLIFMAFVIFMFWRSLLNSPMRRIVVCMVFLIEVALVVRRYAPVPVSVLVPALMSLGVTFIVAAFQTFQSREHRAARFVWENLGKASSALREDLVDKVRAVTWNGGSEENCPICLLTYEDGQQLRRLPCGHMFCDVCLRTWLTGARLPSCPNCRALVALSQLEQDSVPSAAGHRVEFFEEA